MTAALLLLSLYLPFRVEASLYVAAVVWGHDPATFRGLAVVEAGPKLESNPRRYGTGKRWGAPPLGRRWKFAGLMQLSPGRPVWHDDQPKIPPGEVLVNSPGVSAYFGAWHLAEWREHCGTKRALEAWHSGKCLAPGSFTAAVRAARRR